jgi:hypothetical protein
MIATIPVVAVTVIVIATFLSAGMKGASTMNVYIYAADIYCEDCGKAIRERITEEGWGIFGSYTGPADPKDEWSYDSDEYPKGPYPDGGGEADFPQHCGSGPDCLNAIQFFDGTKAGAWLGNELTSDGIQYVKDAIEEDPENEVCQLWAECYGDYCEL